MLERQVAVGDTSSAAASRHHSQQNGPLPPTSGTAVPRTSSPSPATFPADRLRAAGVAPTQQAVRQTVITVDKEPALVHARRAKSKDVQVWHSPNTFLWSPATPQLVELIPISVTSQSPHASSTTHTTEASPHSREGGSQVTSPRALTTSASPHGSATIVGGHALAPRTRSRHYKSRPASRTASVCHTRSNSLLCCSLQGSNGENDREGLRHAGFGCDPATSSFSLLPVHGLSSTKGTPRRQLEDSPQDNKENSLQATPTLMTPRAKVTLPSQPKAPEPARSPSPATVPNEASRSASPSAATSFVDLRSIRTNDVARSTGASAPLSVFNETHNASHMSGVRLPQVPSIFLPATHGVPGVEEDHHIHTNVLGYGPRSAPNVCSLASARSSRSNRSARRSNRCCTTSLCGTMLTLRELFPTMPEELYIARERLCVSHNSQGRLGVGAYGAVQQAELYPPGVEVPKFYSSTSSNPTHPSIPGTPRLSPATHQFPSHSFASIAVVSGAGAGAASSVSHLSDRPDFAMHSRMASMVSVESAATLPVHQQPYSEQTASFYNGLDDLPAVVSAERLGDTHGEIRVQTPEGDSVVLTGSLDATDNGHAAPAAAATAKKDSTRVDSLERPTSLPQSASLEWKRDGTQVPRFALSPPIAVSTTPLRAKQVGAGDADATESDVHALRVGDAVDLEDGKAQTKPSAAERSPNEEEGAGMQSATMSTTAVTRKLTSPRSQQRSNTFTHYQSSRATRSTARESRGHEGDEEDEDDMERDYSDRRVNNSCTLPTPVLVGASGRRTAPRQDSDGLFSSAAPSKSTVDAITAELPSSCMHLFDDTRARSPATQTATAATATATAAAQHAAMRKTSLGLPLVLPPGGLNVASAYSSHSSNNSPVSTGHSGVDVTLETIESRTASITTELEAPADRPVAAMAVAAGMKEPLATFEAHHASDVYLSEVAERSFLASVALPEPLRESPNEQTPRDNNDDTRTAGALQTVMKAMQAAAAATRKSDTAKEAQQPVQRNGDSAAEEKPATSTTQANEVTTDTAGARHGACTETVTSCIHLGSSISTPSSAEAARCGQHPASSAGGAAASHNAGSEVHADPLSLGSTVSSLFATGIDLLKSEMEAHHVRHPHGVTSSFNTYPESSETAAAQQQPPLPPNTNVMRFGVNAVMVSDAIANGCVPFRPVATKVVEKCDLVDSTMKLNAFHNELRMASRLNHPCLVNMYGAAEDTENFYLVMDLAEKGTVAQYQKKFGVKDTRDMAPRFLADVVLALEYLRDGAQHTYWMTSDAEQKKKEGEKKESSDSNKDLSGEPKELSEPSRSCPDTPTLPADVAASTLPCQLTMAESIVLHRDVKPDNLLLTWDFHVKLADFGDACFYGDEEANNFGGTPSYISPEVITQSKAGPYSDLWAVGCILYELLVGKQLFSGSLTDVASQVRAFRPDELTFPVTAATTTSVSASTGRQRRAAADKETPEKNDNSAFAVTSDISEAAQDLVRQLLCQVPEERLGAEEVGGFAALKRHPFFAEIDWATVLETTNMTTTNTDYTAELADYLEAEEVVVYCSPVKLLRTADPLARGPVHGNRGIAGQGSLLMVLTDVPRLFLVNPDTDTVQAEIPWSAKLRVGVLRADRFVITVPSGDEDGVEEMSGRASVPTLLINNTAAPLNIGSKAAAHAIPATSVIYTFHDTNRRADLWGVKIHHLQTTTASSPSTGADRSNLAEGASRFPSRQLPLRPASTTSVTHAHGTIPHSRGTPVLSPRSTTHNGGGAGSNSTSLLHRLRHTPRTTRCGSVSSLAVSFSEQMLLTPREGRHVGGMGCSSTSSTCVSPSTAMPPTSAKASSGKAARPTRPPATSLLGTTTSTATGTVLGLQATSSVSLASPASATSESISGGLFSPEVCQVPSYGFHKGGTASTTQRHNTMNTTSSSATGNPSSSSSHPSTTPIGHGSDVSPVNFGTTMMDAWVRVAAPSMSAVDGCECLPSAVPTTAEISPTGVTTASPSVGDVTPHSTCTTRGAHSSGWSTARLATLPWDTHWPAQGQHSLRLESAEENFLCEETPSQAEKGLSGGEFDAGATSLHESVPRTAAHGSESPVEATPGPSSTLKNRAGSTSEALWKHGAPNTAAAAAAYGPHADSDGDGKHTPTIVVDLPGMNSSGSASATAFPQPGTTSSAWEQYKMLQRLKTKM